MALAVQEAHFAQASVAHAAAGKVVRREFGALSGQWMADGEQLASWFVQEVNVAHCTDSGESAEGNTVAAEGRAKHCGQVLQRVKRSMMRRGSAGKASGACVDW